MTDEDSSRRRVLALIAAVLLALLGAGTGVRDLFATDEGGDETGLDLSVDYSVTPDSSSTPTPTPTGGDPDRTETPAGPSGPESPVLSPTPTDQDSRPDDRDDEDGDAESPAVEADVGGAGGGGAGGAGGGGPTATPSSDLVATSIPPVSMTDLAPGDGGVVDLTLDLSGSPGRLWVRADASNFTEGSVVESERSAGDEGPPGELQDHVRVRLWYDADGDGTADGGERVVYDGLLADLDAVSEWTPLTDDCVSPGTHAVRFRWDLPVDVPSTVQTDGVDFSIGVAAEAGDC